MPKIKPYEAELMNGRTRATIYAGIARNLTNEEELAAKMRCVKRTLQNKLKNPDTLTLKEIKAIAKALKLSNDEIVELCGFSSK